VADARAKFMSRAQQFLRFLLSALCASLVLASAVAPQPCRAAESWLSPAALAASKNEVFIACSTGNRVLRFDAASQRVTASLPLPTAPSGLALAPDGQRLFVTCAAPASKVCVVDLASGRTSLILPAGHTAMAPVLSPDGKSLFVCDRFDDEVRVFGLDTGKERARIPVPREPVAADITRDGRFLLVANHLARGAADAARVAASISVIDTAANKVAKELCLPDGSHSLNDLRVSPDGRHAVVTHVLSHFRLPATQLDRGWMNCNAATIIDLARLEILNTVLLDEVDRGAADPWGVAWSADGSVLAITHAGTHEISLLDFPGLLAKLARLPATPDRNQTADPYAASQVQADVPKDLAFLLGLRQRVKLPQADLGPRSVVFAGRTAVVANYFSDTLTMVLLGSGVVPRADAAPAPASVPLGPITPMSLVRRGEFLFHDAGICFQGWQSCATCHPGDGRADGLNWDLLNDGVGNPKNTKSLLLAHRTPPAMSLGVRETAEAAVRAGIRNILFTTQPEEVAAAIDAYLASLRPVPSPHLVEGRLSKSARRGEKLFKDPRVGCAACHRPGLFTDLQPYDVGTRGRYDGPADRFDTPTLVELWRTAPYLHDGSAATVREVFTTRNPRDEHGKTSRLTPEQITDLEAYLLSL
jgi:DNA-binding beta-propeller fold protein YncE/mono/diheme cytochrome c family protein